MKRNPRRPYDAGMGEEMEPMPLSNMREHGVEVSGGDMRAAGVGWLPG